MKIWMLDSMKSVIFSDRERITDFSVSFFETIVYLFTFKGNPFKYIIYKLLLLRKARTLKLYISPSQEINVT